MAAEPAGMRTFFCELTVRAVTDANGKSRPATIHNETMQSRTEAGGDASFGYDWLIGQPKLVR